jgi:hypothetical protein
MGEKNRNSISVHHIKAHDLVSIHDIDQDIGIQRHQLA